MRKNDIPLFLLIILGVGFCVFQAIKMLTYSDIKPYDWLACAVWLILLVVDFMMLIERFRYRKEMAQHRKKMAQYRKEIDYYRDVLKKSTEEDLNNETDRRENN